MLSADLALCVRNPSLPGMAELLDEERLLNRTRALFPEFDASAACIRYLRYKPHTSCLVAFELQQPDGSVQAYAKAFPKHATDKYSKSIAKGEMQNVRFAADIATVFHLFPSDPKLEFLRRIVDGAQRKDALAKMMPECPGIWDGEFHTLHYKPERRHVSLIRADEAAIVLKLYDKHDYNTALNNATIFDSGDLLRIPKRLGKSQRYHLVASEWLAGTALDAALVEPGLESSRAFDVGVALAELHRQTSVTLPRVNPNAEMRRFVALASYLEAIQPHVGPQAHALANALAGRLACPAPSLGPIHNDFYAKQVLLLSDGVALIDFDEAALGDPAADLGLFLAHLELDALTSGTLKNRIPLIREALLAGYRAATTSSDAVLRRVDVYVAKGLLTLSPHPFRYRFDRWPEQTKALLKLAEHYLRSEA